MATEVKTTTNNTASKTDNNDDFSNFLLEKYVNRRATVGTQRKVADLNIIETNRKSIDQMIANERVRSDTIISETKGITSDSTAKQVTMLDLQKSYGAKFQILNNALTTCMVENFKLLASTFRTRFEHERPDIIKKYEKTAAKFMAKMVEKDSTYTGDLLGTNAWWYHRVMKKGETDYTNPDNILRPTLLKVLGGTGVVYVKKDPTAAGGYVLLGHAFADGICLEVLFFHCEAVRIRTRYFRAMKTILKNQDNKMSHDNMMAESTKAWKEYKVGLVGLNVKFVATCSPLEINVRGGTRKKYVSAVRKYCMPKSKAPTAPKPPPTSTSTSSSSTMKTTDTTPKKQKKGQKGKKKGNIENENQQQQQGQKGSTKKKENQKGGSNKKNRKGNQTQPKREKSKEEEHKVKDQNNGNKKEKGNPSKKADKKVKE